eukprot:562809-Prymnesium_polylepis.1
MILIVKGGAAWRHTELIDVSPSETAESDYETQANPDARVVQPGGTPLKLWGDLPNWLEWSPYPNLRQFQYCRD